MLTNLFVNACLEKIDQDKSKHVAILFQYILRGYSNIDMLAYQVRIPTSSSPEPFNTRAGTGSVAASL